VQKINTEIMPHYYKAKLAADEVLTVLGEERRAKDGFAFIDLRPGGLTDEKETGKVQLGKTAARGMVTRGDVADIAARLLEIEGANGWFDLLGGEEDAQTAVERVVREGVNSFEGEDLAVLKSNLA
jgi:hypothetical protein